MTKRNLILGAVCAAVGSLIRPLKPTAASAASAASAAPAAPKPTKIWVGGTDGEMDWIPVDAETREQALLKLFEHHEVLVGHGPVADLVLERAEALDGLDPEQVRHVDWARAGYVAGCDRCEGGCTLRGDARVVNYELVCGECLTLADRLQLSEPEAVNELAQIVAGADMDLEDAMAELYYRCDVDSIPAHAWQAACVEAARILHDRKVAA